MKSKVLILGHNGMLGHMLVKYLKSTNNYEIHITDHRWPSNEFKNDILNFDGDYIINAIGAIPQKIKVFDINYELPVWLDTNCTNNIIHAGTDCEIDNDEYGISKRKASDYLKQSGLRTKILKASIIGPELNSNASLLEWFLHSNTDVKGFTKAMWSGVTTLEWAKQCLVLISNWDTYKTENIIQSTCLSKFELLNLIKEIFNKDINIISDDTININKCLVGDIQVCNIKEQLIELKKFYFNDSI